MNYKQKVNLATMNEVLRVLPSCQLTVQHKPSIDGPKDEMQTYIAADVDKDTFERILVVSDAKADPGKSGLSVAQQINLYYGTGELRFPSLECDIWLSIYLWK